MRVVNRTSLSNAEFSSMQRELKGIHSLQSLLTWSQSQPEGSLLPEVISDVVVQDEYTHDLVVPWRGFFVVLGTT